MLGTTLLSNDCILVTSSLEFFTSLLNCETVIHLTFNLLCFSADDNDVMFTEEIIRPVLSALKVSCNLMLVTQCSLYLVALSM